MSELNRQHQQQLEERLSKEINLALRSLAGWPTQTASLHATREREHTVTVHRDATGNVIGSSEVFHEYEVEHINQSWGN